MGGRRGVKADKGRKEGGRGWGMGRGGRNGGVVGKGCWGEVTGLGGGL